MVQLSLYTPTLSPEGARHRALEDSIANDIRSGALLPGARLPGTRSLAAAVGVSRGTVSKALGNLAAEGWLVPSPGSGFYVHPEVPEVREAVPLEGGAGFALRALPEPPEEPKRHRFELLGGQADLRLLPLKELARAYGRVLRGRGRRLVGYGSAGGESRLRRALSDWLAATRGVRPAEGGLLVTRGSQMALYLMAQVLISPGDRIAVEALGYRPAWDAFRAAGAELVPVAVDDGGMVVDDLPADLRAVYVTPHHQYPTGAALSPARRMALLRWATKHRMAVFEDDYDHEYHYAGPSIRPLVANDTAGVVVSVGTLSKAFAPGLRVGWVVGPPALIRQMTAARRTIDRQGDRVVEHAVAELIEDGTLERHHRRTRGIYEHRREVLLQLLEDHLPFLETTVPPGGLALWCKAPGIDVEAWAAAASERGVRFEVGGRYSFDAASVPYVRLGFASHTPAELEEAVGLLVGSVPQ